MQKGGQDMLFANIVKQSFLLIAGALIGGIFIILLPYAWIVAGLIVIASVLLDRLAIVAERNAGFGWRPLQAYLTGRKEKRKSKGIS